MTTIKLTYRIISNSIFVPQKTITRTVANNANAYSEFEEKVLGDFENYIVEFNHAGKTIVLSK